MSDVKARNFRVVSIVLKIYGLVGCAGGGFSWECPIGMSQGCDPGKESFCSCRLPGEIHRVAVMETTLTETVRPAPAKAPRLEDQLRGAIRERHYSLRTEEAYVMWYRQFDGALPHHPLG